VGRWLRHGWHVALAYVVGFFFMLAVLGWLPDARHKPPPVSEAAGSMTVLNKQSIIDSGR
jgi:hypothetical protein